MCCWLGNEQQVCTIPGSLAASCCTAPIKTRSSGGGNGRILASRVFGSCLPKTRVHTGDLPAHCVVGCKTTMSPTPRNNNKPTTYHCRQGAESLCRCMLHNKMVLNHTAQARAREDMLHQDCHLPPHHSLWCCQRVGLTVVLYLGTRNRGGTHDCILQKLGVSSLSHHPIHRLAMSTRSRNLD